MGQHKRPRLSGDSATDTHASTEQSAPTATASAAELLDIRSLRRRQAESGGHPLGTSDSEDQPDEWDALDLQEYRDWVTSGRLDVVLPGRPSPGCWDHPWVTYDASLRHSSRQQPNDDETACRPVIPVRPAMTKAVMAQLDGQLPPPPAPVCEPADGPPTPLGLTTTMQPVGRREADSLPSGPSSKRPRLLSGTPVDGDTSPAIYRASIPEPQSCPWDLFPELHDPVRLPAITPPTRGQKRLAKRHGLLASGAHLTIASGSVKRARFREPPCAYGYPTPDVVCGPGSVYDDVTVGDAVDYEQDYSRHDGAPLASVRHPCNDDGHGPRAREFSDDGDALMGTDGSSWRHAAHCQQQISGVGADRAASTDHTPASDT